MYGSFVQYLPLSCFVLNFPLFSHKLLNSEVRRFKVGHKETSPFKVSSLYRVFYCHARYVISLLNLFFPVAGDLPAIEAVEF